MKTMESMQTQKDVSQKEADREQTEHQGLNRGTAIQSGNFTNCSNQTRVVSSHLGNNPA